MNKHYWFAVANFHTGQLDPANIGDSKGYRFYTPYQLFGSEVDILMPDSEALKSCGLGSEARS